jgi:NAD(P)H-dependent FMN reductase
MIVGISGSLRKASLNTALLRAATDLVPQGTRLEIASIRDIPLYDGDLEAKQGIPQSVQMLKDQIAKSRGLLIATPEYNNGIPGVLKNALDWLSRPASDIGHVFGGRPVAVMGASPGRFGTMMAQAAWLPVLRALSVEPFWGPRMLVAGASKVFDASGTLVDEDTRRRLRDFVEAFAQFTIAHPQTRQ